MSTKTKMTFCMQMAKLSSKPGFLDEASKAAFVACAQELLQKGVPEANTLHAMEMIYVSATEYIGSFEATWEADYYLRDQGLDIPWIHAFLGKARGLLDWLPDDRVLRQKQGVQPAPKILIRHTTIEDVSNEPR